MTVSIKNLSKVFGQQKAVDNISFDVDEGEIVGFLGPNGAGKSTTMKIATCYLPPTTGTVHVNGVNVVENSVEARRKIGYLPEHNPLYLDMYLHEYLQFVGRLYKIRGRALRERVAEMVELCGLTREQNKQIGSLSKGYRQRVGLAQALIHNPEVLILDEPTSGLDPNQIIEIRNLIKGISKNKTVIFSTHIMQEVQALCNRVIVIDHGKIVADDSIEKLLTSSKLVIRAEFESEIDKKLIENHPEVTSVRQKGALYVLEVTRDIRGDLFKLASEEKLPLVGLTLEEQSIEGVFRNLTQNQSVNA